MKQDQYILVVDDDVAILETIRDILEFEGYRVKTWSDGATVFDQVRADPPGMVLLDLRMPLLDGMTIYRALHSDPVASQVPVVLVTADRSGAECADELGTLMYLAKPFDIDELVACVQRVMSSPTETAQ